MGLHPPPRSAGADVLNAFEGSPGANLIISNLLRTENPVIDVLIAITLPFILRAMFSVAYKGCLRVYNFILKQTPDGVERIIEFENTQSIHGYSMNDGDYSANGRNEILQKALSMFIGIKRKDTIQKFQKARVNLVAVKEASKYDYDSNRKNFGSTSEQLEAYKISSVPIWDEWMEIEPGLFFFQTRKGSSDNNNSTPPPEDGSSSSGKQFQTTKIQFKLKSTLSNKIKAEKQISDFLDEAFNWYVSQMKATEVGARYYYTPLLEEPVADTGASRPGGNSKKGKKKYERYRLSDEKTFQSLFFPTKTKLLNILDTFSRKEGKYQIAGFPHKLGLMLYGPPGTGKTSTIKAIAQRLNRSIVNIPLARVKTNQQLMNLIYDGVYEVGEDVPVKLGLQDVVYVIEDIDCASRVVHSRKKKKLAKLGAAAAAIGGNKIDIPAPNALSRVVSAQTNDGLGDKDDADFLDMASAEELKATIAKLLQHQQKQGNQPNPVETSKSESGGASALGFNLRKLYEEPDALNLSGILNAIDGVVDSPGRVIIITTNHPEKLDEALIRPGRIDQVIHLGYMKYEQVVRMLIHYYIDKPAAPSSNNVKSVDDGDSVSTEESLSKQCNEDLKQIPENLLERIRKCFPSESEEDTKKYINRTPAEVECMCAECETIEDFAKMIEEDDGTSRTDFESWQ